MPHRVCPRCKHSGRLLEGSTQDAYVEYYRCDPCGHVWTHHKSNPDAPPTDVTLPRCTFRVMQPWGPDKGRQATTLSVHTTAAQAFEAVNRFAVEVARTGAPSDAIELVVVDEHGQVVPRPGTH